MVSVRYIYICLLSTLSPASLSTTIFFVFGSRVSRRHITTTVKACVVCGMLLVLLLPHKQKRTFEQNQRDQSAQTLRQ